MHQCLCLPGTACFPCTAAKYIIITTSSLPPLRSMSTHAPDAELESENKSMIFSPGDMVRTAYGVGVLTAVREDSEAHCQVRIWRIPGESIASSAVAFVQQDAILGKLPACPGLVTTTKRDKESQLMVWSYSESRSAFLVGPANGGQADDIFEIAPGELADAPSATFYPLLEDLMRRGDRTASVSVEFMRNDQVAAIIRKSKDFMDTSIPQTIISSDATTATSAKAVIPNERDVKQIYTMLKDEELTVLLEKGKERLKQLVETDLPLATEQALRTAGITISTEENTTSLMGSVFNSRAVALAALEELLAQTGFDSTDLQFLQSHIEENFTTMFDSLSQAARSDRDLSSIFDTISGKTCAWQETTGRLISTKSVGLFLEGAGRLQARAASIFCVEHMQWAGEIGANLTKAFTERDAALARLKSIELGDAVRSRLVDAIEVRSDVQGGLDGIIAGALNAATEAGDSAGNHMQVMLKEMQQKATTTSLEAHESLISVLSQRSQYRDTALLRIEMVLCSLEAQLGDELSPIDIAALARGEVGTASLFRPIAGRATKEIEKQLEVAEAAVDDDTVLAVLSSVRRIMSGDLSVEGLLDEIVSLLNDESVVSAGETFVRHGETVLDAIEGVSGNKVVGGMMEIVEKAGITKESVISRMEALNMNEILDTAGNAMHDEQARQELISSATDVALDFVLRILPSMPVPPFDGVKDGLVYRLSNLSMNGFRVRKESIVVEVAGLRATKGGSISSVETGLDDTPRSTHSSNFVPMDSAFNETPQTSSDASEMPLLKNSPGVSATELLIIEVRDISALLQDVLWSFEQTYMPYLKGDGSADVTLSNGAIRLQFELRKKRRATFSYNQPAEQHEWEPVLCLHDRSCSIGDVELSLQGEGRLTWIFNKLASIFKGPLRDYVVRTIVDILASKSGYILEQLNDHLAPYWPLIMRTAGLSLDALPLAGAGDIMASVSPDEEYFVELVWWQNLPLGMNLLLNDDSGLLKIVDFPRGSQARAVCEQRRIEPGVFKGATIVAVNGSRYDTREQLFSALKDSGRPKSILFEIAQNEECERVKRFVEGNTVPHGGPLSVVERELNREKSFSVRTVTFNERTPLGIEFSPAIDGIGLVVSDFLLGDDGVILAAERESQIQRGDLLTHVNGQIVVGKEGQGKGRAISIMESIGNERPLTLSFTEYYMHQEIFEKSPNGESDIGGPDELLLVERQLSDASKRIAIDAFQEVGGAAETGGIMIGDHLVFINGIPVGAGCRLFGDSSAPELHETYAMLREPSAYPVGLTFARPKYMERRWAATSSTQQNQFDVESAETICITADSFEHIGCVFENSGYSDVVVTDLFAVPGPIQRCMNHYKDASGNLHLSIESVNGQFVPSYATPDITKNAMRRSWAGRGRIELVMCDDNRKMWIHRLS